MSTSRGWELGLRGNNETIFLLEALSIKEAHTFKEGDRPNLPCTSPPPRTIFATDQRILLLRLYNK